MNYTYYKRYQKPKSRRRRGQYASFFWFGMILVVLVLILKACVSVVSSFSNEKRDDIVLSIERGEAELLSFGQSEWEAAPDLGVILEGDSIQSAEGSLTLLTVHDGPTVRMDESTYLSFDRVEKTDSGETRIHLVLHDGRLWFEESEASATSVVIHTDIMDLEASGQFLVSNLSSNESLYVFDGSVSVDYVDRGLEDVVLESQVIPENYKSLITPEMEAALLARETITLTEPMEEGELLGNNFVRWSLGSEVSSGEEELLEEDGKENETVDEESTEEEQTQEEELTEEEPEEEIPGLTIQITSPASGTTDSDGAIAIEGRVVSGVASRIVVTWSGNGQAYELGLFEKGQTSFRYVADQQYSNFAAGQNTYTIVAYDEAGNPSNSVTLQITGDF